MNRFCLQKWLQSDPKSHPKTTKKRTKKQHKKRTKKRPQHEQKISACRRARPANLTSCERKAALAYAVRYIHRFCMYVFALCCSKLYVFKGLPKDIEKHRFLMLLAPDWPLLASLRQLLAALGPLLAALGRSWAALGRS